MAADYCFLPSQLWDEEFRVASSPEHEVVECRFPQTRFRVTWDRVKKRLLMDGCGVNMMTLIGIIDGDDLAYVLGTLAEPACPLTCIGFWMKQIDLKVAEQLSSFFLQTSRLRYLRIGGWDCIPNYPQYLLAGTERLRGPHPATSLEVCAIAHALGSPACPLRGLSLHVENIAQAQALGDVLVRPQCNLRCLSLTVHYCSRTDDWEWVERLLMDPACKLVDLGLEGFCGSPRLRGFGLDCGLKRLSLWEVGIGLWEEGVGVTSLFTGMDGGLLTDGPWPLPLPDFCRRLEELVVGPNYQLENVTFALELPHCKLEVLRSYVKDETTFRRFCGALIHKNCKLKCLRLVFDERNAESFVEHLADALRSEDCKLESLQLILPSSEQLSLSSGLKLVNALESNLTLCTLEVQLRSSIEERLYSLLRRNQLLREGRLLQYPRIKSQSARLFLCGHERVGKTTIRKQIYYLVNRKIKNPLHKVQTEAPTQGMELQAVTFGKNKLVLCDLAGHKEYHAFHHFIVTGSDRDLFLLVCKDTDQPGQLEFSRKLRYWFRFVASHRTPGNPCPKVIVVLNFFDSTSSGDVMTRIASDSTRTLMEEYADVLDFGQQMDIRNVFGINAKKGRDFGPLICRLEGLLTELLDSRPLIPKICGDISAIVSSSRKRKQLFLPLRDILLKYWERFPEDHTERYEGSPFRAALVELHNAGEIVFFPSCDKQDDERRIVIVDCQWFCRNLIGILMQPEEIMNDRQRNLLESGVWLPEDVRKIILQQKCEPEHVSDVVEYLRRLELFYEIDSSKWMFPSLLPEARPPQWKECDDKGAIFGRRLECEDKAKTLLPAGAFARLQVKLHAKYGNLSWEVGCGWLSFLEDRVATIVRFGGESSRWEDRQWIDIMVRFSEPREHYENTAEDIVHFVKKAMFSICQGIDRGFPAVSLRECVMGEGCVRALESGSKDVVPLEDIKETVRQNGIRYNLPWSDHRSTPILQSFLPGELKELVAQDLRALGEIEREFHIADCDDADHVSSSHAAQGSIEKFVNPNLSEDNRLLLQCIYERFDIADKNLSEGLSQIRNKMELLSQNIQHKERNIFTSCSYQLVRDLITGPLPAFPFLTDTKGLWQPIKNLVGKEVELHFMCEWHAGVHEVDRQMGLRVKIDTPKWLVRAGPVLVPALKVACCAVRLAATLVLPGSQVVVPSFESLSALGLTGAQLQHRVLPEILKSFVDQFPDLEELISGQVPVDKSRLRDFLFDLTKGKHVDMERDFGLLRVEIPEKQRIAWVCRDHSEGLRRLTNQDPFQS